jgi:RNA polymerase sigma-70 factor (ECF subfamily)
VRILGLAFVGGVGKVSGTNSSSLRAALSADYEQLAKRLARSLGSADIAREALHETFLRMERVSDAMSVRSPVDYIFRTAINVAKDRRKSDNRLLSANEIAAIVDIPDDGPNAFEIVADRAEFDEFGKALSELSERRRQVFIAAHIEQIPHDEIAKRFGINARTVAFDLQHAMEHLSQRLGRKVVRRFGPKQKDKEAQ